MDKKILMQKAYNWIAEQDEHSAIISDGDVDIASEFIAEFIQNLIDNGALVEPSYENAVLPIFDVSKSYCGEQGNDNMKADIKEIMHACGDKFDFIKLCNEAQEELDEAAFDLDQESRMNGV